MAKDTDKRDAALQTFADNLKYLIGDDSVLNISRQMGIPQQTLHRYLHCQREIGLFNLMKIADFFNEDLDYLTGRKN